MLCHLLLTELHCKRARFGIDKIREQLGAFVDAEGKLTTTDMPFNLLGGLFSAAADAEEVALQQS